MKLKEEKITTKSKYIEKIKYLSKEAFPKNEYLSPYKLIEMAQEDNFDFFALTDNNEFIGYMAVKLYKNLSYLFFLAIMPEYRSKGYGTATINLLKEKYENYIQVVDFEKVDKLTNNYDQREKRKLFYIKNGYQETGLFISYLGVTYEVLSMDKTLDIDDFKKMLADINIKGFNPIYNK